MNLTIFLLLARTCTRIPDITLFTSVILYWFLTLTLTLVVAPFLSRVAFPTIKFTSTLTWDMFYEYPCFIYSFDHIKFLCYSCINNYFCKSVKFKGSIKTSGIRYFVFNFFRSCIRSNICSQICNIRYCFQSLWLLYWKQQ